MKSFKMLRNFARQGGRSREKPGNDGVASSDGGLVEPTQESELIAKGMEVGREALHSGLLSSGCGCSFGGLRRVLCCTCERVKLS